MSVTTAPDLAPLRAPRSARWSATLGVGGIGVQLIALGLIEVVRGQARYGVAVTLVTAGVLAGVGALACGGWWWRRVRRRARAQRAADGRLPASRPAERGLVLTGLLTGVVSAGWLIPVAALGVGYLLVGS
jgi:hypothetical protein